MFQQSSMLRLAGGEGKLCAVFLFKSLFQIIEHSTECISCIIHSVGWLECGGHRQLRLSEQLHNASLRSKPLLQQVLRRDESRGELWAKRSKQA